MKETLFIIKGYIRSSGRTYDILTKCKPLKHLNAYNVVDLFYKMSCLQASAEDFGYIITFKVYDNRKH